MTQEGQYVHEASLDESYTPTRSQKIVALMMAVLTSAITGITDRAKAAMSNMVTMGKALRSSIPVNRVLGGTGTGKTTSFMMDTLKSVENGQGVCHRILVVPTKSLVTNCWESIIGLLRSLAGQEDCDSSSEHVDPVFMAGFNCVIHPITDNTKGWKKDLDKAYPKSEYHKKSLLVICNSTFFSATEGYWLSQNFDVMYDEPDDKSSGATSVGAIHLLHSVKKKNYKYNVPHNLLKRVNNMKEARYCFEKLREIYVSAGNSYDKSPTVFKEYLHSIFELRELMSPYTGKVMLSSATMPAWAETAIDETGMPNGSIEMKKPVSTSGSIYLPHFDRLLGQAVKEGNMSDMMNPMIEQIVPIVKFINSKSAEQRKHFDADDLSAQMRRSQTMLVPVPGLSEVTELSKQLEQVKASFGCDVIIMTPYNRERTTHIINNIFDDISGNKRPIPVIIEIIPGHEARGMNFNAGYIMVSPVGRCRSTYHNTTELGIEFLCEADVKQMIGRAGRQGPCIKYYLGSKKLFASLDKTNPFPEFGISSHVVMLISKGLSLTELETYSQLFKKANGYNLKVYMARLVEQGFVTVNESSQHFELTRNGKLSNIFHDQLDDYLSLEDHMLENKTLNDVSLLRVLIWLNLIQTYESGNNKMFAFPEDRHMGFREAMRYARDEIGQGRRVDSHAMLLWFIVENIFNVVASNYDCDLDCLYRYATYKQSSPLGIELRACFLNCETIRNCVVSGLNQRNRIVQFGLLEGLDSESDNEFVMNEYLKAMTLKALSTDKMQIAVKLPTETYMNKPGVHVYADNKGNKRIVNYDLIEVPSDITMIIVMSAVIKPSMRQKRLGLATMIFPMSIFGSSGSLKETLSVAAGLEPEIAHSVSEWFYGHLDNMPFQLIENEGDMLNSILFTLISGKNVPLKGVSSMAFDLLKAISVMKKQSKDLSEDSVREMYDFFGKLFKEHTREMLSNTGATDMESRPLPFAFVKAPKVTPVHMDSSYKVRGEVDRVDAFAPRLTKFLTTKKGEAMYGIIQPDEVCEKTRFQEMNMHPRYEKSSTVEFRRDRWITLASHMGEEHFDDFGLEDIAPRPCCTLCRTVDDHDEITYTYVVPPDDIEYDTYSNLQKCVTLYNIQVSKTPIQLIMPFHTNCLKVHTSDPDFGDYCPYTGGYLFDTGMTSILKKTPEQEIKEIKLVTMKDQERNAFIKSNLLSQCESVTKMLKLKEPLTEDVICLLNDKEAYDMWMKYTEMCKAQQNAENERLKAKKRSEELKRQKEANKARLKLIEDEKKRRQRVQDAKKKSAKGTKSPKSVKSPKGTKTKKGKK